LSRRESHRFLRRLAVFQEFLWDVLVHLTTIIAEFGWVFRGFACSLTRRAIQNEVMVLTNRDPLASGRVISQFLGFAVCSSCFSVGHLCFNFLYKIFVGNMATMACKDSVLHLGTWVWIFR